MNPQLWPAKVAGKKEIARDTFQVDFTTGNDFTFTAGQYVWVVLPKLLYEDSRGARRAFSIVSSPSDKNSISIVFRNSQSGYKRTLLELPLGSQVEFYGPCGTLALPEQNVQSAVMLAGGVGVAPFMSMIRAATEAQSVQPLTLIYSNSDKDREAYRDELDALRSKNPHLLVVRTIGAMTFEVIAAAVPDLAATRYYVLGPQPMVNVVDSFLAGHGVKKSQVVFEECYPQSGIAQQDSSFLMKNVEIFKMAVESSTDHIVITDVDGKIVFANRGAEIITRFTKEEMLGQTPRLWGGLMDAEFYRRFWQTIKVEQKPFTGEIKNRRKNGDIYFAIAHISPIFDMHNLLVGFIGTETDITERIALDRAKSEFVSTASHQLRTPLTAIKWVMELLVEDKDLTQKQKEKLNDIQTSNERLIEIVNHLLNISRIEAGTLKVDKKPVAIVERINASVKILKPNAENKKQRITVAAPADVKEINLDPMLFDEAFNNLLSNAINYSPEGATIAVAVSANDTGYAVSIANPADIPKTDQEKLFSKFYRGENAKKSTAAGSGLGLYICKSAVEANGGAIALESSPGKGTTFSFTVPRA